MSGPVWYIPSWNGDIRFEAEGDALTVVKVIEPTLGEIRRLRALSETFIGRQWVDAALWDEDGHPEVQVSVVRAPLLDVAPLLVEDYAPGRATLTAIRMADDTVKAYEMGGGVWAKIRRALRLGRPRTLAARPVRGALPPGDSYRSEAPEPEAPPAAAPATAVATVKRPTICCPQCIEGPITPAREVLFAFLTSDEKDEYLANDHSLVVTGAISGHRYLLSHRHARWARRHGKICHDLDTCTTLHFHDHTVPPEEELLAAKLILEHREHWLVTRGSGSPIAMPSGFGDFSDGLRSTAFTDQFGGVCENLERLFSPERAMRDAEAQRRFDELVHEARMLGYLDPFDSRNSRNENQP